jgi:hypothetical protein
MNYIARLQGELAEAQEQLQAKDEALRAFRAQIAGEKFSGFDKDGSRKDWIAVRDVDARLVDTWPPEPETHSGPEADQALPLISSYRRLAMTRLAGPSAHAIGADPIVVAYGMGVDSTAMSVENQ